MRRQGGVHLGRGAHHSGACRRAGERRQGEHPRDADFQDPVHDGLQRDEHGRVRGDGGSDAARVQGARRGVCDILRGASRRGRQRLALRVRQPGSHPHPRRQVPGLRARRARYPGQKGVRHEAGAQARRLYRADVGRCHTRGHRDAAQLRLAEKGCQGISGQELQKGDVRTRRGVPARGRVQRPLYGQARRRHHGGGGESAGILPRPHHGGSPRGEGSGRLLHLPLSRW